MPRIAATVGQPTDDPFPAEIEPCRSGSGFGRNGSREDVDQGPREHEIFRSVALHDPVVAGFFHGEAVGQDTRVERTCSVAGDESVAKELRDFLARALDREPLRTVDGAAADAEGDALRPADLARLVYDREHDFEIVLGTICILHGETFCWFR